MQKVFKTIKYFFWDKYFLRDEILIELSDASLKDLELKIDRLKKIANIWFSLNLLCFLLYLLSAMLHSKDTSPVLFLWVFSIASIWAGIRMSTTFRYKRMYQKKLNVIFYNRHKIWGPYGPIKSPPPPSPPKRIITNG